MSAISTGPSVNSPARAFCVKARKYPPGEVIAGDPLTTYLSGLFATVFFALMDQFWRYVTNWVYGAT